MGSGFRAESGWIPLNFRAWTSHLSSAEGQRRVLSFFPSVGLISALVLHLFLDRRVHQLHYPQSKATETL